MKFLSGNPHTFLAFSMAAAKLVADAAHRCGTRGLVTAIAGNGRRMGIRVSGLDSCSRRRRRWVSPNCSTVTPSTTPAR